MRKTGAGNASATPKPNPNSVREEGDAATRWAKGGSPNEKAQKGVVGGHVLCNTRKDSCAANINCGNEPE